MSGVSRRRFLEAGAMLAAMAPLAACKTGVKGAQPGDRWRDAVAEAAAVAGGHTTALGLVDTSIARLDAVNGKINAVHFPNFERARAMARAGTTGPLAGVPTLIKDNLAQKGLPYTEGSRAMAENIAEDSDPYALAVEATGAISIGRSTLPEFGLTATTAPLLTGITRNPWNLQHSPGGSSGGSAAAVAAGVVSVAHANDGGGSIRIPASACGLVGLKPSRRRMAGAGSGDAATDLSVQGCLSRTVRDTAAWFAATQATGAGAGFPPAPLVTGPAAGRLKVGLRLRHPLGALPGAEVRRVFGEAAALLTRLGHKVQEVPAPYDGAAVVPAFLTLWEAGAHEAIAEVMAGRPDADPAALFEPLTLGMAAAGAKHAPERIAEVTGTLTQAMHSYRAQFSRIDVYMAPVLGAPPARIGYIAPTIPYERQKSRLIDYAGFTGIENIAGVPSIALPIGQSSGGLPIGIQFAAAPGEEARLLALGYELERELLWYRRRPPVWVGDLELTA